VAEPGSARQQLAARALSSGDAGSIRRTMARFDAIDAKDMQGQSRDVARVNPDTQQIVNRLGPGEYAQAVAKSSVPDAPRWAQMHAFELHGDVVSHDDDTALVKGWSEAGRPVYLPVNRETGVRGTADLGA